MADASSGQLHQSKGSEILDIISTLASSSSFVIQLSSVSPLQTLNARINRRTHSSYYHHRHPWPVYYSRMENDIYQRNGRSVHYHHRHYYIIILPFDIGISHVADRSEVKAPDQPKKECVLRLKVVSRVSDTDCRG
jgi:hypothetical protein